MGEVEQLAMFDSFPVHVTFSSATVSRPVLSPYKGMAVVSVHVSRQINSIFQVIDQSGYS